MYLLLCIFGISVCLQTIEANAAAREVISLMESYNLTREDWDSVMEIGKWGNEADITKKIPTKVRVAFFFSFSKLYCFEFIYLKPVFHRRQVSSSLISYNPRKTSAKQPT